MLLDSNRFSTMISAQISIPVSKTVAPFMLVVANELTRYNPSWEATGILAKTNFLCWFDFLEANMCFIYKLYGEPENFTRTSQHGKQRCSVHVWKMNSEQTYPPLTKHQATLASSTSTRPLLNRPPPTPSSPALQPPNNPLA